MVPGTQNSASTVTTTSLSVLVFFVRQRQFGWARTVVPGLALIGFGTITYFALSNFSAITGTNSVIINGLPLLHLLTIVVAVGVALYARKNRRDAYANMGRALVG
jgi:hypothetical protein